MADLLYCGTKPVGPESTQALLAGQFQAIWSPPMHRRTEASVGDRVWLVWRDDSDDTAILLGGGVVVATPEGRVDWTNRTAPGIVAAARARGYRGPTNMAFLRLKNVRLLDSPIDMPSIGTIPVGLSVASSEQGDIANALLSIE